MFDIGFLSVDALSQAALVIVSGSGDMEREEKEAVCTALNEAVKIVEATGRKIQPGARIVFLDGDLCCLTPTQKLWLIRELQK